MGSERCEAQREELMTDGMNWMPDYAGCVPKCERAQREFIQRYREYTTEALLCEGILELVDET